MQLGVKLRRKIKERVREVCKQLLDVAPRSERSQPSRDPRRSRNNFSQDSKSSLFN